MVGSLLASDFAKGTAGRVDERFEILRIVGDFVKNWPTFRAETDQGFRK